MWTLGGASGGIVVGLVLVALNGTSIFSLLLSLGFGIAVGAAAGLISFIIYTFIYQQLRGEISSLVKSRKN